MVVIASRAIHVDLHTENRRFWPTLSTMHPRFFLNVVRGCRKGRFIFINGMRSWILFNLFSGIKSLFQCRNELANTFGCLVAIPKRVVLKLRNALLKDTL